MIIDVFYRTQNPEAITKYKQAVQLYNDWFTTTFTLCKQDGFERFVGSDFCVPQYFLRSSAEHIQKVGGFRQLRDSTLVTPPHYIPFVIRTDHVHGNEVYRQLAGISAEAIAGLGISGDEYGTPRFNGFEKATCMNLGIYQEVLINGVLGVSQIWAIENERESLSLICSLPVRGRGPYPVYEKPDIPVYWKPLNSLQVIEQFNIHNVRLKKKQS
ncbi:hypothetical protein [Photorhabdus sp. RM96S]|uniref:hypothetical protein n=1 Tax=Photorhabdus sp. RM96S TaxID=3342822 RepID=UPI0036DC343D